MALCIVLLLVWEFLLELSLLEFCFLYSCIQILQLYAMYVNMSELCEHVVDYLDFN